MSKRIAILEKALMEIKNMADVRGRFIGADGTAIDEDDGSEGVVWLEYNLEEQNAAMEAIAEIAMKALTDSQEACE